MPIFNDNISKVLSGVKDVDKKLSFSVEFIPANVVYSVVDSGDIVTKKSKDGNLESSKIVNAIYVTKYGEDVNSSVGPYYPLFRGLVDTPTRGDSVLVCEFPVGDTNYYIGPINSLNLPSFNPDEYMLMEKIKHTTVDSNISGEADSEYLTGYPKTIGMLPIARLQKPYRKELDDPNDSYETKGMSSEEYVRGVGSIGDYVIEGRFGNSIRFGSRSSNPNMIISNGRFPLGGIEAKDSKYETLNDGTLISFSTKGKLNDHFDVEYIPSCNDEKKNTKLIIIKSSKD